MRWALPIAASLVGCAAPPAATTVAPPAESATASSIVVTTTSPPRATPAVATDPTVPQDAAKAQPTVFQIGFYQFEVPQGTISANDAFWKPFDETFLGPWQHDVLHKNGLRVGRAPLVELAYLREQLAGADETPQNLIGTESKDFEMEVRRDAPPQTIFYYDRNGALEGRNYEPSDDVFAVNFRRAARSQDRVRISVAPMVRLQRSRFVVDREKQRIDETREQTFYDLGVKAELGVDECLVISPSASAAENPTSVGKIFMLEDRPAERVEKILVIVPKVRATLNETAARP